MFLRLCALQLSVSPPRKSYHTSLFFNIQVFLNYSLSDKKFRINFFLDYSQYWFIQAVTNYQYLTVWNSPENQHLSFSEYENLFAEVHFFFIFYISIFWYVYYDGAWSATTWIRLAVSSILSQKICLEEILADWPFPSHLAIIWLAPGPHNLFITNFVPDSRKQKYFSPSVLIPEYRNFLVNRRNVTISFVSLSLPKRVPKST